MLRERYAETLLYQDVVDQPSKRIGVYREKLRIDFSKISGSPSGHLPRAAPSTRDRCRARPLSDPLPNTDR
jgi:hypothetical protein